MAPPTVIVANDDDLKNENAKLKAQHEEDEKTAKANDDEKKDLEAKLKANLDERIQEPGPVVKAIIAGMDEDHKKDAKARIAKLIAEEDDPEKKEAMKKANEEIFDTGNGENTNAQTEEEKEKTAVIASLSAKVSEPIINKILTAKTKAGASESEIAEEQKRLTAMTLPAIEKEFESNKIFINQQLTATQVNEGVEALTAAEETKFDFNGVNGALVGKAVDIDAIVGDATL